MKTSKLLLLPLAAAFLLAPSIGHSQTLLEKIAMTVLADQFGIDTSQVSMFQQETRLSVYDLAPTYEAAHYFNRDPRMIRQLRNQGLGWGEIAHRIGMQPGEFNKLLKQGALDGDLYWQRAYSERFDVTQDKVVVLRRGGATLDNILAAIVAGKLANKDPQTMYDQFRDQRSWTTITRSNNVSFDQWRRISSPTRTRMTLRRDKTWSKSSLKVRGHGKGDDMDKMKGKSKKWDDKGGKHNGSKGRSKGKGKSKDD